MSALAKYLFDLEYLVRGCDYKKYFFTEDSLIKRRIVIDDISDFKYLEDYIYIIGSAFDENNSVVKEVKEKTKEFYYYNDFIGSIIKKEIFAVSGTHGKTTTSRFLASMLGDDVSCIIGDGTGKGTNSKYLVLEACEYKEHFLSYHPKILIVNNIELDHPDYFKNIKDVINTFQKLVNKSDLVLVNNDDLNTKKLKGKNIISVGTSITSDIIFSYLYNKDKTIIEIKYAGDIYNVSVNFKGKHLIYDFVMAYVLCLIVGVKPNISNISFPRRRMEETKFGNTILIDDYAHHPTEIKALHEYISLTYPNRIINVIFQPHTYSRTLKLKKEFIESLSLFDNVYIDKVFTSSRECINTYNQLKINKYFKRFNKFDKNVLNMISKDKMEIWVFLGAGETNKYIHQIINNENN